MKELIQVPVLFDQEHHTYAHQETGEVLHGITSTLLARLFPRKYDGIPADILAKAAEHGTLVHEEIELAESIGITPTTVEALNYCRIKEHDGFAVVATEYLVSDLIYYASSIDLVLAGADDNTIDLADIKTTSKLDKDYVSWQLSIYAYLAERQNPGLKVGNLYAIWLRGDIARRVQVARRTDEEIEALMKADMADEPYDYTPATPSFIAENEETLIALDKRIKELQEEYDQVKAAILEQMAATETKSVDTGAILVTYIAPSERESFDSKRFKAEHADIYSSYTKTTQTKESLKITIR